MSVSSCRQPLQCWYDENRDEVAMAADTEGNWAPKGNWPRVIQVLLLPNVQLYSKRNQHCSQFSIIGPGSKLATLNLSFWKDQQFVLTGMDTHSKHGFAFPANAMI